MNIIGNVQVTYYDQNFCNFFLFSNSVMDYSMLFFANLLNTFAFQ